MADYIKEEELKEELIRVQNSQKMKVLKSRYLEYIADPIENYRYKDNMELYKELEDKGFIEKYSRETYGLMLLTIVEKLATRGNFAGYTWRDDFYSNAIQRILSYSITNFDHTKISKKTGGPVKAFAYITQIAMNAFIEIINERKLEHSEIMDKIVPLEDLYFEINKLYRPRLERADLEKEYPSVKLRVVLDDLVYNVVDQNNSIIKEFTSIVDVLKDYDKNIKISLVYPDTYIMSLSESDEIFGMNFEYLNISRYEKERYKPSFPKNKKEAKEDLFEDWF